MDNYNNNKKTQTMMTDMEEAEARELQLQIEKRDR